MQENFSVLSDNSFFNAFFLENPLSPIYDHAPYIREIDDPLIQYSPRRVDPFDDDICEYVRSLLEDGNASSSTFPLSSHDMAQAEILEILNVVCETHKLPLAQTWVPCGHYSLANDGDLKKSCSSSGRSDLHQYCMFTTKMGYYVKDYETLGCFREACAGRPLKKGQGVVGRAFSSRSPCFCRNITQFCKTEYPLVHHASKCGLTSCFAICLRSSHTGDKDYILEFFLPPTITDNHEQETLLRSLLVTMKQHFQSLSGIGLENEFIYVRIQNSSADDQPDSLCEIHITQSTNGLPDGEKMLQLHQLVRETHAMNDGENVFSEGGKHSAVSHSENAGTRKTSQRKCRKIKRKITFEDLQNFCGRCKDAAEHFEVSVSTIKRLCREYGINNWHYRKKLKNNQSLSKPKHIDESIEGEGAKMRNQMAGGNRSRQRELNHEQIGFSPESGKGSDKSHIGVGLMEESSSQMEITPVEDMVGSSTHNQCIQAKDLSELPIQSSESNLLSECLRPQIAEEELPISLCISATEELNTEQVPVSSLTNPSCSELASKPTKVTAAHIMPLVIETQDTRTVTMKATYGEMVIRFQLSLTSGINELRKEVAESLDLKVGTFIVKYYDDEDWILMSRDKDLQECFNISLGRDIIKLSIHDKMQTKGN